MPSDSASRVVPALTPVPTEPSFFVGCLAGLAVGSVLVIPVWFLLLKL
jgi:hypothetical protein